MKFTTKSERYYFVLVLLGAIAAELGCSEPSATIHGVVELDNSPMRISEKVRGTVVFQPASRQGPTLTGIIDKYGQFCLTAGSKEYVAPGVYIATVSAVEIVPPTKENPQPSGKRITPERYSSSGESGLRFVIKPGSNEILIKLTSEGAKAAEAGYEANIKTRDSVEHASSATPLGGK